MIVFRWITTHPMRVLGAATLVTLAAAALITRLEVNNSVEIWLVENDPALQSYHEFKQEFQNDEYVVIGYEPPGGILSDDALALTSRVTEALERIDGVLDVKSITTVEEIRAHGDELEVGKLVSPPLDDTERARILDKLATDPLYAGTLASRDGHAAAIVASVERVANGNLKRRYQLLDAIEHALEAEGGTPFYLTGTVAFDIELFRAMVRDQSRLIPLMGVVFVVVLGLLFRSVAGVLLPSVTVVIAVVWTFGLIGLSGYTVNVVSAILPVVLLAIGVADAVHLISEYEEQLAHGSDAHDALPRALSSVWIPCLFTSVTTALGFAGLMFIRVAPLREFGLWAAAGTILAFIATFTIVPAALAVLPRPRRTLAAARPHTLHLRATGRVFQFVSAHRVAMLSMSVLLLAVGAFGLPHVYTSANWYKYLSRDNPTIRATDFVEQNIGGVYTIDVMMTPGRQARRMPEAIKDIAALAEVEKLEAMIEADPTIQTAISPVDFIKSMNRALHGDDPAYFRLPDTRDAVGQYLLMYELDAPDGELYDFMNFDFTRARITARSKMSETETHQPFLHRVRRAAHGLEHVHAVPTGLMVLYSNVEQYMLSGMVRGFTIAFLAVTITMILLLRTLRHGLLSMIPGALPIIFVVGCTGWLGIALGTMPAMMGNVALGITVDNAIHMLTRYRRLRGAGIPARDAIGQAVTVVGRPVLYTSIVLCLGFGILGFSELQPNKLFGLLTATILLGSLAGSLITLPATVLVLDEWTSERRERRAAAMTVRAPADSTDS